MGPYETFCKASVTTIAACPVLCLNKRTGGTYDAGKTETRTLACASAAQYDPVNCGCFDLGRAGSFIRLAVYPFYRRGHFPHTAGPTAGACGVGTDRGDGDYAAQVAALPALREGIGASAVPRAGYLSGVRNMV